jgi:hypothetical protein
LSAWEAVGCIVETIPKAAERIRPMQAKEIGKRIVVKEVCVGV